MDSFMNIIFLALAYISLLYVAPFLGSKAKNSEVLSYGSHVGMNIQLSGIVGVLASALVFVLLRGTYFLLGINLHSSLATAVAIGGLIVAPLFFMMRLSDSKPKTLKLSKKFTDIITFILAPALVIATFLLVGLSIKSLMVGEHSGSGLAFWSTLYLISIMKMWFFVETKMLDNKFFVVFKKLFPLLLIAPFYLAGRFFYFLSYDGGITAITYLVALFLIWIVITLLLILMNTKRLVTYSISILVILSLLAAAGPLSVSAIATKPMML